MIEELLRHLLSFSEVVMLWTLLCMTIIVFNVIAIIDISFITSYYALLLLLSFLLLLLLLLFIIIYHYYFY